MVDKLIHAFLSNLADAVHGFIMGSSPLARPARTMPPGRVLNPSKVAKVKTSSKAAPPSEPAKKPRKKGPIQLCPVPGCKNRAAPVFGMVCVKHKDMPKAKIAGYREARRAKAAKNVSYGKLASKGSKKPASKAKASPKTKPATKA